jgi:hypothetical protein
MIVFFWNFLREGHRVSKVMYLFQKFVKQKASSSSWVYGLSKVRGQKVKKKNLNTHTKANNQISKTFFEHWFVIFDAQRCFVKLNLVFL